MPPGDAYLALARHEDQRPRRNAGLVALGGGALGAAVMGVLALGVAPADAPSMDRRAPVTNLVRPTETVGLVTPGGRATPAPAAGPTRTARTP